MWGPEGKYGPPRAPGFPRTLSHCPTLERSSVNGDPGFKSYEVLLGERQSLQAQPRICPLALRSPRSLLPVTYSRSPVITDPTGHASQQGKTWGFGQPRH